LTGMLLELPWEECKRLVSADASVVLMANVHEALMVLAGAKAAAELEWAVGMPCMREVAPAGGRKNGGEAAEAAGVIASEVAARSTAEPVATGAASMAADDGWRAAQEASERRERQVRMRCQREASKRGATLRRWRVGCRGEVPVHGVGGVTAACCQLEASEGALCMCADDESDALSVPRVRDG
jgi:hypothetical protein